MDKVELIYDLLDAWNTVPTNQSTFKFVFKRIKLKQLD